jgi:hypothetical protein
MEPSMTDMQVMKVELHYFFGDNSHFMDAAIRHKCEGEILKIIEEISSVLHLPLTPQTEAYHEGGLKEVWAFAKSNPYILGVITGVLINVLSDQITIDRELVDLQKESLRLEIQEKKINIHKLKDELESGDPQILNSISEDLVFILNNKYRVLRSRSDFYKNLYGYQKVTKISGQQINIYNEPTSEPAVVERDQFKNFILSTDELPKEVDESATIELISPVLKKGKFKWRGFYEGDSIDFYMKDKEFKNSIFNQQISFTNGVSLKCILEIKKKMNEIGEIYVSSYSVITVVSYNFGEDTVETKHGKQYFRTKDHKKNQMDLFKKK